MRECLEAHPPHARIISMDTGGAEALGAVCVTPWDVPQVRYNERQVSIPSKTYRDRSVLPFVARHVGEGVAAVAARAEASPIRTWPPTPRAACTAAGNPCAWLPRGPRK